MAKLPVGFTKRADGYIMCRFTVEGKRYTVYGNSVKECREKEQKKRDELKNKVYKSSKSLSMEEYLERWLQSRERVITSQTMRTYKKLVNSMCRQILGETGIRFGEIKLCNLESQNVRDLQTALLKTLTTRTTNDISSLLKKALTAAVNERYIVFNPAACVERVKRTEAPARDTIHRSLSREEVAAFLEAAEGRNSSYYNLYVFLLYTGLRVGEASALTIKDVTNTEINVHKTVVRSEIGYEIANQTKTAAGTRRVPLYPQAAEAFDRQKKLNEKLDRSINISKPVFRLPQGGIIRPDRVNSDIKAICDAAGIEKFSCHAFRATFASRCVQSRMSTRELMEIMGHTDVQMTLGLYAHSEDEEKRKQLLAVNF